MYLQFGFQEFPGTSLLMSFFSIISIQYHSVIYRCSAWTFIYTFYAFVRFFQRLRLLHGKYLQIQSNSSEKANIPEVPKKKIERLFCELVWNFSHREDIHWSEHVCNPGSWQNLVQNDYDYDGGLTSATIDLYNKATFRLWYLGGAVREFPYSILSGW